MTKIFGIKIEIITDFCDVKEFKYKRIEVETGIRLEKQALYVVEIRKEHKDYFVGNLTEMLVTKQHQENKWLANCIQGDIAMSEYKSFLRIGDTIQELKLFLNCEDELFIFKNYN